MVCKNSHLITILATTLSLTNLNPSDNQNNTYFYNKFPLSLEERIEIAPKDTSSNFNYEYFSKEELKEFDKWIDSTLKESEIKKTNSIIVNKLKKELYLIKSGEVHSEYPIDLGFNPIEDKQKEGDGCTPEGMYTIQRKLPLGATNFYKAFLINYPNKQDKSKGKTGGLIEVHGHGGLGFNWTLGCMALSNEEIDKIFPYINEGDRITIVRETTRNLSSNQ